MSGVPKSSETSSLKEWLDSQPITLGFRVTRSKISISTTGHFLTLTLESREHGFTRIQMRTEQGLISFSNIPITFDLWRSTNRPELQDALDRKEDIGHLKYHEPIHTSDGVVNQGDTLDGTAILRPDIFDSILPLVQSENLKSSFVIEVKRPSENEWSKSGFNNANQIWDISTGCTVLAITALHFNVEPIEEISEDASVATKEILAELLKEVRELKTLIAKGVRIRLFD